MNVCAHLDITVWNLGCRIVEFPAMGTGLEGGGRVKCVRSRLASEFSTVTVNAKRKWMNIFEV